MEFEVLGPVRLRCGGRMVSAGGRLQATLLGVLLARANTEVPVGVLVEALWGRPDDRAGQRLQLHVHRLRRTLDDPDRLTFGHDGYRLRVAADELDAARFESLLADAGTEPEQRAEVLRQALDLWRGEPYAGLDVPMLADEAARLAELRLTAAEEHYAAETECGRGAAVVADLVELVRRHPLRERAHLLLITALYQNGRRADALAACRAARNAFVAELGVEPGGELRALEARILDGEPAAPTGRPAPVPAQLPRDVPGFVGREAALAQMDDAGQGPVVISGTAGVGKTALAVRWAHRARERFPGGQLYVDLHGYGPGAPAPAEEVLAGFLRALGVDGAAVPAGAAERAARFRSLVRGRRLLVVLDNARSVAQVQPLLPGDPSCFVVVTSRDSLTGLAGAVRVDLDRLAPADALGLVRSLTGERADAEPDAVAELVNRCARLPLALRIAAEAVRARTGLRIADVVTELGADQGGLDLLDATGDPRTDIRAVFSWSYRHLTPAAASLFRLMGLLPVDVATGALGALAGLDPHATRQALESLVRAHLVEEERDGRYGMHDLLRVYAAECAAEDETGTRAAMRRLLSWYLNAAVAARQTLIPASPRLPMAGYLAEGLTFTGPADALAWFETERPVLAVLVPLAAEYEEDGHGWRLAAAALAYYNISKHWDDWVATHRVGVDCAVRAGDLIGEATVLNGLGVVYDDLGDGELAIRCHERAAELFAAAGEQHFAAWNLNNMGVVLDGLGRYAEAIDTHRVALGLFRAVGDRRGEGYSLNNLGDAYRLWGKFTEATVYLQQALELQQAAGDNDGLRYTLSHLADLYRDAGQHDEAVTHYGLAIETSLKQGDRWQAATMLTHLAELHASPAQTAGSLRAAHELFNEVGDAEAAAAVRTRLSELTTQPAS